jgi:succinate-semialdehyde dehydrogenase/glutarate-semialdehyde dehydrogenase
VDGRPQRHAAVVDPATEDVLAEVADAGPQDGLDAVGAAADAQPG